MWTPSPPSHPVGRLQSNVKIGIDLVVLFTCLVIYVYAPFTVFRIAAMPWTLRNKVKCCNTELFQMVSPYFFSRKINILSQLLSGKYVYFFKVLLNGDNILHMPLNICILYSHMHQLYFQLDPLTFDI